MSEHNYEKPTLTVLGDVAELTEGKGPGVPDTSGADGAGSFVDDA